jgi:hypothetical protein
MSDARPRSKRRLLAVAWWLVDLSMLAADLHATVRTAIAPSWVGLWLREADR